MRPVRSMYMALMPNARTSVNISCGRNVKNGSELPVPSRLVHCSCNEVKLSVDTRISRFC